MAQIITSKHILLSFLQNQVDRFSINKACNQKMCTIYINYPQRIKTAALTTVVHNPSLLPSADCV